MQTRMESYAQAFTRLRQSRARRQAQRWAIRLDGGGLSALERGRLKSWLANDQNAIALRSAQETWRATNATQDTSPTSVVLRRWGRDASVFTARRRSRVIWVCAAVASCLALVSVAPTLSVVIRADSSTAPGEQRLIVLDDGSRVLLNTDSAIDVQYTPTRRVVRLLSGEAQFEVARNERVPFVVETSGGSVTALGTVFDVRTRPLSTGGGALVIGVEHRVRVEAAGGSAVVAAGEQTSWSLMHAPASPTRANDVNAVGWSTGVLQFEDAPLRDIVRELNRYTGTRVVVVGAARDIRLSGVFLVKDPIAGLLALESSKRLKLTRLPGLILARTPD